MVNLKSSSIYANLPCVCFIIASKSKVFDLINDSFGWLPICDFKNGYRRILKHWYIMHATPCKNYCWSASANGAGLTWNFSLINLHGFKHTHINFQLMQSLFYCLVYVRSCLENWRTQRRAQRTLLMISTFCRRTSIRTVKRPPRGLARKDMIQWQWNRQKRKQNLLIE